MDDVDKLDNIQDGFIHYQLLRFCQATRLQYINGQITLTNQNDHKIANALLKKGTLDIYKTWNQHDRAWVDMRLHESHDDGGFGVSSNTITRLAASYTTNAICSLPGHLCLPRSAGLAAGQRPPGPHQLGYPPLRTLMRLHEDLLHNYDCTDQPPPPPPSAGRGAAANAGAHPQPQQAGSQDDGNGKLVLPQLNRLHEAFKRNQIP
jgi:hypothetical protein